MVSRSEGGNIKNLLTFRELMALCKWCEVKYLKQCKYCYSSRLKNKLAQGTSRPYAWSMVNNAQVKNLETTHAI